MGPPQIEVPRLGVLLSITLLWLDSWMNEEELKVLRKSIHDMNNGVGVILATAELLQMEALTGRGPERTRLIEANALKLRDLLRDLGDHYLG